MSEITARLRGLAALGWSGVEIPDTANEAADEIDRLRAELDALRGQEPAFWYIPAEGEDDEDALLLPMRDGTSPAIGALPLYAAPVATPAPVATTDERIKKEVAFFREQVTKQWKPSPYGEALPAPWMFLSKACDYIEQVSAAPVAQVPGTSENVMHVLADLDDMAQEGWMECARAAAVIRGMLASAKEPVAQKVPAGIWMREFVDAVEREAFKIRAPNTHTPVLIGMCNEARRRLFAAAQAQEWNP